MAFLWLLSVLSCTSPAPSPPPPPEPPPALPTVVVITLDTTRADRLGSYGHAAARTPNLDALAERGVRFSRAFSPVPLTIPSHATLFTGLLPPHHGVHVNGDARLSEHATTLAERLQANGWHTHASVGAYVTQQHWGFGQGFDGYDDQMNMPTDRLSWHAERPAEAVVDDALVALDGGANFLWVHVFDAHYPYVDHPAFPAEDPYDSELAYIDHHLGRLIDALPAQATIVVAGDHGEAFGAGGEAEHGLLVTKETLHVPLIVVHPGVDGGQVSDRPVSLADVTPTLLRLLGLPVDFTNFDGQDLLHPTGRTGVYSEALQGHYLFGWAPIRSWTGPHGRLIQGVQHTAEGTPPEDAHDQLVTMAQGQPAWDMETLTLEPSEIEMLQALGYVATTPQPNADETGMDPREGVLLLEHLSALQDRPIDEQEQRLRALADAHPRMRDVRYRLSRLLAAQGRLDEAMVVAEEAYRIAPDSTTAIFVGAIWMQFNAPHEALHWYQEALLHDPRSLSARAGEVESLTRMGQLDEARATASVYLERVPDHGRMLMAVAALTLAEGAPVDEWLDPITDLALRRPYEPGLLQLAAALHHQMGQPEQAIAHLRQELQLRPHNTPARLELAGMFHEQNRLVDVIKTIRPLLTLQPEEPQWHAIAAQAYLEMGRADRAAPHLEACAGDPHCPSVD